MKIPMHMLDHSELLEKGFRLAYLITQDRLSSIEIVTGALEKLSVQCRREKRRFYWRYNRACQSIRRITRQELDAFQWLIMFESELYERAQEQRGSPLLRDMVVRYIKHLVQSTISMSSFYVCVGMNRLLYSYSTSETQTAFELATERFPGADQYRRAKKMLASRLRERFGELIETVKTRHGELRFKTLENQNRWENLVKECLAMFSPWSTEGCCEHCRFEGSDLSQGDPERVRAERDIQEMIYCHMFIEPMCRENLLAAVAISSPEAKLALPIFAMVEDEDGNSGLEGRAGPKLSLEERALIAERMHTSQVRRQGFRPESVSVVVDGSRRSRFSLTRAGELLVDLSEGDKLIEIHGESEGSELLLGTHMLTYAEQEVGFSKAVLPLKHGELELTVSPCSNCDSEARAVLTFSFKRKFQASLGTLAHAWIPLKVNG
ncbi:MAG: hypothetical protein WA672_20210 [Candidatus Angelobacter sp.]